MIMSYLRDIINENKANENAFNENVATENEANENNSNEWKIQINMDVNFVSSNDTEEIDTIFIWSNNEETELGNETDDIIKGLINSFFNNHQKEEIILRNGSNFVFESVDLLSYHIHKTSLKRDPEWLVNKRATINKKTKIIGVFNIL